MRAIFILVFVGLSQSSLAEKSTRTEYYSIFGTTGIELLNEMSSKGPQGYSGYTRHEYSYDYGTSMINGRCRVSRMSMDMDITYTMPRWENESSANTELRGRWSDWYRLLEQHEYGHSAFAESGYSDILSGWRRIGGSDNCQDIRSQVEQIYNSISTKVNQQNAEYDQATNHGQSQGATYESLAGNEGTPSLPDFSFDSSSGNYWWLVFASLIGLLIFVRKS